MKPGLRAWLPLGAVAAAAAAALGLALGMGVLALGTRWPLWLLLALPWAWLVHVRGRAGLSATRHVLVGVARIVLLLALVLALCDPRTLRTDDRAVLVFAIDVSDSVPAAAAQDAVRFALAGCADKPAADEVGLVFFGRNAGVELPPATSLPFESINVAIDRSGTDLGEGLATAAALVPPDRPGRIVLASDGADNAGRLEAVLGELARRGIPVDVLGIEYDGNNEVWVEKVELPLNVRLGDTIAPSIVLGASAPGSGDVVLTDNGVEVARQRATWNAGKTRLSASLPLRAAGYHELRAHVAPDPGNDFWPKNNDGIAGVYVAGRGKVLLVRGAASDGEDAHTLARALRAHEREVDVVVAPALPSAALHLLEYDAIAIVDAPREDLALPQMQALHDAVFHQGSGLLMLGSPATFGPGGFGRTPIEEALPVTTDLPDKKHLPQGALAIILHTCEFPEGNTWAKRITLQAMKVLHPRDLVGVLACGARGNDWVFPLTPAERYDELAVKVNAAQIGDMPGFQVTMRLALDALNASGAALKHVIVISDGDPQPPTPALVAKYQETKITVSTVTVFPHGAIDTNTMQAIADATGGRHYQPKKAEELPAIFVKEAKTARTPVVVEKTFTPGVLLPAPALAGLAALPPLHGYVLTQPKARALTVLEGPDEEMADPVLVQWRYGVGAAAAFTSDLGGRWGRDWVAWPQYHAFVHQLFADIARNGRPQRLFARALASFGQGLLQVEDHGDDAALLDLQAELRGPRGSQTLPLVQVGPRRYEARFPVPDVGRYEATISAGLDRTHAGFAVTYGAEYSRFRSHQGSLRLITARTLGRMLAGDEHGAELFARPPVLPRSARPWSTTLLWLAAALLLLEVAFRRVQLGWTRQSRAAAAPATAPLLARKRAVAGQLAGQARGPAPGLVPAAEPVAVASAPARTPPPLAQPAAAPAPAPDGAATTTQRLLARKRARGSKPIPPP